MTVTNKQVTDKQVLDAMEIVRKEMENWRLLPMGDGYARIMRSPAYIALDSRGPGEIPSDEVVQWFDVRGSAAEIKKQFDERRTFAALKKSMESFCARAYTPPKA